MAPVYSDGFAGTDPYPQEGAQLEAVEATAAGSHCTTAARPHCTIVPDQRVTCRITGARHRNCETMGNANLLHPLSSEELQLRGKPPKNDAA
jgi:hypothetical protein